MKRAIILFTRVPLPGKTKTRLMPFLSGQECARLHECFILDIYRACAQTDADILVCCTPDENKDVLTQLLDRDLVFLPQRGRDLGERMSRAFRSAFRLGYEKVLLIGTDIPQLTAEILRDAFDALSAHDAVIHPTADGGYYLIGMTKEQPELWHTARYGTSSALADTLEQAEKAGLKMAVGQMCRDVDTKEDLFALYRELGQSPGHTGRYLQHELREKLEKHE